jgi:hypothetical protein
MSGLTNLTRDNLADFFQGYDSGLLLDLEIPEEYYCNFQDLAACLRDPQYKEKEKVITFLEHIDDSSVTEEFYSMFEDYRHEAGLPYIDEVLNVEQIIKCIRS